MLTLIGAALLTLPSFAPTDPDERLAVTDVEPCYWASREMGFPIRFSPEMRGRVQAVTLMVSDDLGKTWSPSCVACPVVANLPFIAERDGVYQFRVQLTACERPNSPCVKDPLEMIPVPVMVVVFKTVPPEIKLAARRCGDVVLVSWEISDLHPDLTTFRLEYQAADEVWREVAVKAGLVGMGIFRPETKGPVRVRLSLSDLARNQRICNCQAGNEEDMSTDSGGVPPEDR